MNVLLMTDEVYPLHIGGAGVVASQIGESLESQNINLVVKCTRPCSPLLQKIYATIWPTYVVYFFFYLLFNKYDRIIINDLRSAYIIGFIGRKKIAQKCVYLVHGTEVDIVFSNRSIKNTMIFLSFFYSKFVKNCLKVIYVSNYVAKRTQNIYSLNNVAPKVNAVCYAGLNRSMLNIAKKINNNLERPTSTAPIRLVSYSRLERRKGYLEMIDIFESLISKGEALTWHIFGSGSLRNEIINEVNRRKLFDQIKIFDALSRYELQEKLSLESYDAYWLLPNLPEAFGLTYIECSALGLPVFGPKKYGIEEAISEGKNGFFFTCENDFLANLKKIKLSKSLYSEQAKIWALNFNCDDFAKELIS